MTKNLPIEQANYLLPRGATASMPLVAGLAIISMPLRTYADGAKEKESDPVSAVSTLIFLAVIYYVIKKFIREMKEVFTPAKEDRAAEVGSGQRGSKNAPGIQKATPAPSQAAEPEGDRVSRLAKFYYTSKSCANCNRWGGQREVVTPGLVGVDGNAYGKCYGGEWNRLEMPCGAGVTCETWALWPAADPMNGG